MVDEAVPVVPIYIALDESSVEAIRHFPTGLRSLRDRFQSDPHAQRGVKVQVVAVGADRCATSRWFDVHELQVPAMTPSAANFGAATLFRTMRASLEGDMAYLKRGGSRVHRPLLFVLAVTPPALPWRDDFRLLSEYDTVAKTGFKLYPMITPICLSDGADQQLSSTAFPPNNCESYVASNPGDMAASVAGAFVTIYDVVSKLWSDLLSGQTATVSVTPPAGIRRSSSPPMAAPEREPADTYEPAPTTLHESESAVHASEPVQRQVAYLQLRCMQTGDVTWNRFENYGTAWLITESTVDTSSSTHEAAKNLSGAFDIAPEFSGCARCGNRSYFRCDCGHVSCWDASTRSCPCHWCHQTIYISGTMTAAKAVD